MTPRAKKIFITMGSQSDWPVMNHATDMLDRFDIAFEVSIISAHRTPKRIDELADRLANEEFVVVIAGAGGAAHLAGAIAARTIVPVIGVPMPSQLQGFDSLLSTVQMPAGIPVATVSIGVAGAKNAALLAVQIAAQQNASLSEQLREYRRKLEGMVPAVPQLTEAAE